MRKSVSQMTEEEYARHQLSLDRRIFFWSMMEATHPVPLVVFIIITYLVGSCMGWCK